MTTAYSTNLGLALPVEGELSGTWGDMVNNGITDYLDIAVAGTLTLNGDGAVTLADTNGDTTSTNIGSTTAQYAVIKITGTLTTTKVITAPSHSKTYVVDNSATGGTVTLKASGQTGISVAVGEKCNAYFNGTDYVKVASSTAVTGAAGSTTQVQYNSSGSLAGSSNFTFDGSQISVYGVGVGRGAGAVSTNTAVGASALAANTTAADNTAIGYQAAYSTTTDGENTAVGHTAFYSNTTGNRNVAVGKKALYSNTGADANTAVGYEALLNNTTAEVNSAFGFNTLRANTTGTYNTALGALALYSNTTASNNTAVGYQAGYSTTTSYGNVCLGYKAGYSVTTSQENTFVGANAGELATGYYNTFVGKSAGSAMTTGYSNTIIGKYSGNAGGLDIRTASNYIVLSDGDGNPRAYWNAATMYQNGDINATGNITAYYSSDIKFKENVRDIPDALATVNAIGGKLFDWTDEYIESKGGADGYFVQKADFGVVAQDVQKVFPIAVRTRQDGSLAVDYEKLGALAFAALVELTKRVEALETK